MSLINEVLRKLDQRPAGAESAAGQARLRAAGGDPKRRSAQFAALAVFLAGAGAGAAGWWIWAPASPSQSSADATAAPAEGAPAAPAGPGRQVAGGGQAEGPATAADREARDPSAGQGSSQPPLELEVPALPENKRVRAAPPPKPGGGGEGDAGPEVKKPRSGRLKVAVAQPAAPASDEARDGPQGAAGAAAASSRDHQAAAQVQVNVPDSWKRQHRAGELARAAYRDLAQRRYSRAVQRLTRARQLAPQRTDIINNLALAQWQAGQRSGAVATLTEGLRAHPDNPRMAGNLAHFLLRADGGVDRSEGARVLTDALQRQDRLALYALVGSLYRDLGRPRAAIQVYQRGIARKGDNWRLLLGLGLALEADGQPDPARRAYAQARKRLPDGRDDVRRSLEARLEALGADSGD